MSSISWALYSYRKNVHNASNLDGDFMQKNVISISLIFFHVRGICIIKYCKIVEFLTFWKLPLPCDNMSLL